MKFSEAEENTHPPFNIDRIDTTTLAQISPIEVGVTWMRWPMDRLHNKAVECTFDV